MFWVEQHHPWGMPITITIYFIGSVPARSFFLPDLCVRERGVSPIARLAVFLAIVLIFGAMIGIAWIGKAREILASFMFFVLNNMRSMFAVNGIL